MVRDLLDLSLLHILPSSIRDDYQVQAAGIALDPELQSASHDIREALILSRIDELPEPVLDLLLWQWHADFPELARNIDMKRAMVKGSIRWHRKKGTVWAIKEALRMLGIDSEVTEWWKTPGAKPYTFAVDAWLIDPDNLTNPNGVETVSMIRRAVIESKAARSWMSSLRVGIGFQEEVQVLDSDDDAFMLERLIVLTEPYPWPGPLHNGEHRYGAIFLHDAEHSYLDGLFHDRRRHGAIFHNGGIDSLSQLEISLSGFSESLECHVYYDGLNRHDRSRIHGLHAGPIDDGVYMEVVRAMRYDRRWAHDQPGFRYNSLKRHDKLENHEGSGVRNAGTPRIVRA